MRLAAQDDRRRKLARGSHDRHLEQACARRSGRGIVRARAARGGPEPYARTAAKNDRLDGSRHAILRAWGRSAKRHCGAAERPFRQRRAPRVRCGLRSLLWRSHRSRSAQPSSGAPNGRRGSIPLRCSGSHPAARARRDRGRSRDRRCGRRDRFGPGTRHRRSRRGHARRGLWVTAKRGRAGVDRGPRFERLLVERQQLAFAAESFRAHWPEMAFVRRLLRAEPIERGQSGFLERQRGGRRCPARIIASARAGIVIGQSRFEPVPVRPACRFPKRRQEGARAFDDGSRLTVIGMTFEKLVGADQREGERARALEPVEHRRRAFEPV